jgi:hypothetical protein
MLPLNPALVKALTDRDPSVLWKDLFSVEASLPLLFNLSIVDSILKTHAHESDDMKVRRESWFSAFVEGGGLAHLMNVFLNGLPLSHDGRHSAAWSFVMRNRAIGSVLKYLTLGEAHIASVPYPPLPCGVTSRRSPD